MSNIIPGYAVHGVATEFGSLATNNTFVTDCAKGAPHYRKIGEHHAVLIDGSTDCATYFSGTGLVYQTIPTDAVLTAPKGHTLAGQDVQFGDLPTLATFTHKGTHYRKVAASDALLVGPVAGYCVFASGVQVRQTFPTGSEISEQDKGSPVVEPNLKFEPCESIRLTILNGIPHEAEIVEHDRNGKWKVEAIINGTKFAFIVYEDQIIKSRQWLVSGYCVRHEGFSAGAYLQSWHGFTPQDVVDRALHERSGSGEGETLRVVSVIEHGGVESYVMRDGSLVAVQH
jgi:hypothetical protein